MGGVTNTLGYVAAALAMYSVLKATDWISWRIDERRVHLDLQVIQHISCDNIQNRSTAPGYIFHDTSQLAVCSLSRRAANQEEEKLIALALMVSNENSRDPFGPQFA